jgi:hypothetical protein
MKIMKNPMIVIYEIYLEAKRERPFYIEQGSP